MERENDNRTPLDRIQPEFMRTMMAENEKASGRGFDPSVVDSLPLAMVYAPRQKWRDAYAPDEALLRGTMFAELDKPFYHGCSCGGNRR